MWQSQSGTSHRNVVTVWWWSEAGFMRCTFSFSDHVRSCLNSCLGGCMLHSSFLVSLSGFYSFTQSRGHMCLYIFHMHNVLWMLYYMNSFLSLLQFLLCFPSPSHFYGPISLFHIAFLVIPAHHFLSLFFALVITMWIHSFTQWAWDLFENIKRWSLTIWWPLLCLEWCFRPRAGMMKDIKCEF